MVPHEFQRYATTGDWQINNGHLHVSVSEMGDWRMNVLVGIHEAIEAVLCTANGITQQAVDKFDMAFEARRGPLSLDEPGDDDRAPYYRQHQIATGVERTMAAELGVSWNEYENANLELYVSK